MKSYRWLNLVFFVLLIAMNWASSNLEINGNTVASVSDSLPSVFTPAGYVFAIWGIIYLALGAFVIYGVSKKQAGNQLIDRIGPWFMINSLLNMVWLVAWLMEWWLISLVIIALMLVTLIIIYLRLNAFREDVRGKNFWFVLFPFSIYLAWISVATIANTSIIFVANGITSLGVSGTFWTAVMIIVATLLSNLMVVLRRDWFFPLVVIWAVIGIAVANEGNTAILITAIVVVVEQILVLFFQRKQRPAALRLQQPSV
jgi:translocator protein